MFRTFRAGAYIQVVTPMPSNWHLRAFRFISGVYSEPVDYCCASLRKGPPHESEADVRWGDAFAWLAMVTIFKPWPLGIEWDWFVSSFMDEH